MTPSIDPGTLCSGIALRPDDPTKFVCRCCGDTMTILVGEGSNAEYQVTPGGFCWNCGFGQCPETCPNYVDLEDQPTAADIERWELEDRMGGPCPECGNVGACGYDSEGRAMIHVMPVDSEDD